MSASAAWPGALRWGALAAYSGLIYHLSSRDVVDLGVELFEGADKLEHACGYAVWGALASSAIAWSAPRWGRGRVLLLAAALGALYGASDELHQSFVPGREATLGDLGADAAGALLGAAFHALWRGRRGARPAAAALGAPPRPPAGTAGA